MLHLPKEGPHQQGLSIEVQVPQVWWQTPPQHLLKGTRQGGTFRTKHPPSNWFKLQSNTITAPRPRGSNVLGSTCRQHHYVCQCQQDGVVADCSCLCLQSSRSPTLLKDTSSPGRRKSEVVRYTKCAEFAPIGTEGSTAYVDSHIRINPVVRPKL